ncbi:MAG: hypothetical protein ABIR84_12240 [Candidatus Nitrotoga sp.]
MSQCIATAGVLSSVIRPHCTALLREVRERLGRVALEASLQKPAAKRRAH